MEIIAELENAPRGVYTGMIGYLAPGRQAQFNVAIRTVVIEGGTNEAEYGVGGGIVWDSNAAQEFEECRTKALVLTTRRPDFELLESILWSPEGGYLLLQGHLSRLGQSAAYFGYALDEQGVRRALLALTYTLPNRPQKVRLLLAADGAIRLETGEVGPAGMVRAGLATRPITSNELFLYHKTTWRRIYEEAAASRPDCAEVILWNERDEITESTTANIVVRLDGALLTPPLSSGLLPGVFREHLIDEGIIREQAITLGDLARCDRLYLINSVRKWRPVELVL
jgi:para-aminobenzoate synthetase/4-amino-4-deoxychorismate lyase